MAQARRPASTAPGGGLGIEGVEGVEGAQAGSEEELPTSGEEQEMPHARGPDVIGMEDMGPQGKAPRSGLDMEAAVGRPKIEEKKDGSREEEAAGAEKKEEDPTDAKMQPEASAEDQLMIDTPHE